MARKNFEIGRKGLILVLVPLGCNLLFLTAFAILLQQSEAEVERQMRSKAIIAQANQLSKSFYDCGVAMGGYSITKSPLFAERFERIKRDIPQELSQLKVAVGHDNDKQLRTVARLEKITADGLAILNHAKASIDDNRLE
jgi:CHASE3 domain sensor protein